MGLVSVLIAALGGFAVGAAWYMNFAKQWVAASGVEVDENGQPVDQSKTPFIIAGICMVLVSGMMRHMFAMSGIDGLGAGLVAGIGVGLFFIAPWVAMNYVYAGRPRMLMILDGGYAVFGCAVIGAILGLF